MAELAAFELRLLGSGMRVLATPSRRGIFVCAGSCEGETEKVGELGVVVDVG